MGFEKFLALKIKSSLFVKSIPKHPTEKTSETQNIWDFFKDYSMILYNKCVIKFISL